MDWLKQKWAAAIRQHALRNYDKGGWDILVECWSDEEIAEILDRTTTWSEAFDAVEEALGTMDERRREIESTAW